MSCTKISVHLNHQRTPINQGVYMYTNLNLKLNVWKVYSFPLNSKQAKVCCRLQSKDCGLDGLYSMASTCSLTRLALLSNFHVFNLDLPSIPERFHCPSLIQCHILHQEHDLHHLSCGRKSSFTSLLTSNPYSLEHSIMLIPVSFTIFSFEFPSVGDDKMVIFVK